MPELTIAVRVPWPKDRSLAALERAIFGALMAAGRALLLQALAAIEEQMLADGAGARQRRRRRYLLTRFGEVRFHRWHQPARPPVRVAPAGLEHPHLDGGIHLVGAPGGTVGPVDRTTSHAPACEVPAPLSRCFLNRVSQVRFLPGAPTL